MHPKDENGIQRPTSYPNEQPHPSTNQHHPDWRKGMQPLGPLGLLIEMIIWNGLVIDQELRVWQSNEEPIDIVQMPIQSLKVMIQATAARARTRAEWSRGSTKAIGTREIDREASQIDPQMETEKQGYVRTVMMGGTQAKSEIAAYDQDVDPMCDHCGKAYSTSDHIIYHCEAFEKDRKSTDEQIAALPRKYLPMSVRCCIAPAMQTDGRCTYWGKEAEEDLDESQRKLLGINKVLTTPGVNAEVTEARQEAIDILDDLERGRKHARKTMMMHKRGHATGENPVFPSKDEIERNMQGLSLDKYIDIYGDGSYTTPKKWWCALGGAGCWIPQWGEANEQDESRAEQNIAVPINGQAGSSTRMELAAWITALSKPIRSNYATDSASMLGKALHLLQLAQHIEEKEEAGIKVEKQNPLKKVWGLQRDGDLWELAWQAILTRGANNKRLRKVKGHATEIDIAEGRSNNKDQHGNDKADKLADEGVRMVKGKGLVCLGKWTADRHKDYVQFMRRMQLMVANVLIAEKEARANKLKAEKAIRGYDPTKWLKTKAKIRNEGDKEATYEKHNMPRPVLGLHKFKFCNGLYTDVHRFLQERTWAHIETEGMTSGTTWLEIFILFDVTGARSEKGQHIKNEAAAERATARRKKQKTTQTKGHLTSAVVRPSLDEELKRFKAIVRHIAKHEMQEDQGNKFEMEKRAQLKRLAPLGVVGSQPAIKGWVKMTPAEQEKVARSIMLQKLGADVKCTKRYDELKQQQSQGTKHDEETMLIKYSRIALGSTIKWTRTLQPDEATQNVVERRLLSSRQLGYSRMIHCLTCNEAQETKMIQLRTQHGYRAIHCKGCKRQQRVAYNKCQCGKVWHQCELHAVDPEAHYTRKAIQGSGPVASRVEKRLGSRRKAPKTKDDAKEKKVRTRRKDTNNVIRHIKFEKNQAPPNPKLLQKLRARIAERKVNDEAAKERHRQLNKDEKHHERRSNEIKVDVGCNPELTCNQRRRKDFIEELKNKAEEQKHSMHGGLFSRKPSSSRPSAQKTTVDYQEGNFDNRARGGQLPSKTKGGRRGEQEAVQRLLARRRKVPS